MSPLGSYSRISDRCIISYVVHLVYIRVFVAQPLRRGNVPYKVHSCFIGTISRLRYGTPSLFIGRINAGIATQYFLHRIRSKGGCKNKRVIKNEKFTDDLFSPKNNPAVFIDWRGFFKIPFDHGRHVTPEVKKTHYRPFSFIVIPYLLYRYFPEPPIELENLFCAMIPDIHTDTYI